MHIKTQGRMKYWHSDKKKKFDWQDNSRLKKAALATERFCHHSPSHDPDGHEIGGKLYNGGQEEIQVHVATKSWSAERYTIINYAVYKPAKESHQMTAKHCITKNLLWTLVLGLPKYFYSSHIC